MKNLMLDEIFYKFFQSNKQTNLYILIYLDLNYYQPNPPINSEYQNLKKFQTQHSLYSLSEQSLYTLGLAESRNMDNFQTFSTGNRKKFLDQAKKKKQQTAVQSPDAPQAKKVQAIQANIRKYLSLKAVLRSELLSLQILTGTFYDSEQGRLLCALKNRRESNLFLQRKLVKEAVVCLESGWDKKEKLMIEEDSAQVQLLRYLLENCGTVLRVLGGLTSGQKYYCLLQIIPASTETPLLDMSERELNSITTILEQPQKLIRIMARLAQNQDLCLQLINLATRTQLKPNAQWRQLCRNLSLETIVDAYQSIAKACHHKQISVLQPHPLYLVQVLSFLTEWLIRANQHRVLQLYNVDPVYLKTEREAAMEILNQKQEWQCFMESMDLACQFNASMVQWYLQAPLSDGAMTVASQYISVVLQALPIEYPLKLGFEHLLLCFAKIGDWVRVHEIVQSEQQQKLLLTLILIVERLMYKMTDKEFLSYVARDRESFQKMLKDRLIKVIYKIILITRSTPVLNKLTTVSIRLLSEIYNRIFRTAVFRTEIFVNEILSKKFSLSAHDEEISSFLRSFPFIFSIKTRARKFRQYITNSYYQWNILEDQQIGRVKIRRGRQFEDAFKHLKDKDIRSRLNIVFINEFGMTEAGVDAGGLTKQFINRVLKAIFRPEFGMFVQNSDNELLPHPKKAETETGLHADYYEFIGKMIGKALFEGITIGPKFCGPFLNAIIGQRNNFDDLQKIDKQLYNGLVYIKTMEEDASDLQLSFQYKDETINKVVNLKKDGHKIKVTNENKEEYISLLASFKVNKLLQFQARHIRKGLRKVIDSDWLHLFNYEQLNYLISGSGEIKIYELRNLTRYVGYNENSPTIKMFWSVVEELDDQGKSNLLMFVTSCPRPSFLGFEDLKPPFTISKKENLESLPVAHTCSNVLDLPDYNDREVLKKKLLTAISSASGFEIA